MDVKMKRFLINKHCWNTTDDNNINGRDPMAFNNDIVCEYVKSGGDAGIVTFSFQRSKITPPLFDVGIRQLMFKRLWSLRKL